MKKKNQKVWVVLLAMPYLLLATAVILQFAARLNGTSKTTSCTNQTGTAAEILEKCQEDDSAAESIINIGTSFIGVISVLMILGTPVWIVMLVRAIQYNKELESKIQEQEQLQAEQYSIHSFPDSSDNTE